MKIPEGLKNAGKFLRDTGFVLQVEGRVAISEKMVDFADFVRPTEEAIHESSAIQVARQKAADIAKRAKPIDAKVVTVAAK